jgi:hypothetical protein
MQTWFIEKYLDFRNFIFKTSQITFFLGENGTGKTPLLNLIKFYNDFMKAEFGSHGQSKIHSIKPSLYIENGAKFMVMEESESGLFAKFYSFKNNNRGLIYCESFWFCEVDIKLKTSNLVWYRISNRPNGKSNSENSAEETFYDFDMLQKNGKEFDEIEKASHDPKKIYDYVISLEHNMKGKKPDFKINSSSIDYLWYYSSKNQSKETSSITVFGALLPVYFCTLTTLMRKKFPKDQNVEDIQRILRKYLEVKNKKENWKIRSVISEKLDFLMANENYSKTNQEILDSKIVSNFAISQHFLANYVRGTVHYKGLRKNYFDRPYFEGELNGINPEDKDALTIHTAQKLREKSKGGKKDDFDFRKSVNDFLKKARFGYQITSFNSKIFREGGPPVEVFFPQFKTTDGKNSFSSIHSGDGIHQLFPIMHALSIANSNLILSQPELHLHPRASSYLGELLYEVRGSRKINMFIETHSREMVESVVRKNSLTHQNINKDLKKSEIVINVIHIDKKTKKCESNIINAINQYIPTNSRYFEFIDEEIGKWQN